MMTNGETTTKEFKDHTHLRAWQVGNDLLIQADGALQEYRDDAHLRAWCEEVFVTLRDSVVQLIEAYYKSGSSEKLRRYEAALFYIHRATYTLQLGQSLGWWQLEALTQAAQEYAAVVRRTAYHFRPKNPASTSQTGS